MSAAIDPRPVLVPGAVYWSDNARRICDCCAGMSALCSGRDISGRPVLRMTGAEVRAWPNDLGAPGCEAGCTVLSPVAGPDGWPLQKGGAL